MMKMIMMKKEEMATNNKKIKQEEKGRKKTQTKIKKTSLEKITNRVLTCIFFLLKNCILNFVSRILKILPP